MASTSSLLAAFAFAVVSFTVALAAVTAAASAVSQAVLIACWLLKRSAASLEPKTCSARVSTKSFCNELRSDEVLELPTPLVIDVNAAVVDSSAPTISLPVELSPSVLVTV